MFIHYLSVSDDPCYKLHWLHVCKLSGCCHKCERIHCGSVVHDLNDKFLFPLMLFVFIYYEGFTCSMHLHAYNKHCSLAITHIIMYFLLKLYVFSHL